MQIHEMRYLVKELEAIANLYKDAYPNDLLDKNKAHESLTGIFNKVESILNFLAAVKVDQ